MLYTYFGRALTLPRMREMSVTEQRYKAVLAVIARAMDRPRRWGAHALEPCENDRPAGES